jgi:hypothetical protein
LKHFITNAISRSQVLEFLVVMISLDDISKLQFKKNSLTREKLFLTIEISNVGKGSGGANSVYTTWACD